MVAPVTSLSKDKIRILLLEGIHASAVDNLARAGYQNVEQLKGALDRDTLLEKVQSLGYAISDLRFHYGMRPTALQPKSDSGPSGGQSDEKQQSTPRFGT